MSKGSNNKAIKVLIICFIAFFALVAGYEYLQYGSIFNNTEHFRKIYATALEQRNNEEFAQAYSTLDGISPRYEAYDAVLFQQAQCATKTGDELSVQKKLKSLIAKYPQSYLYIPAKYDLAKSYLRSHDNSSATATFENIINNHQNTDFEVGSYYYLADLDKAKNIQNSLKYWRKYIEKSQNGRFSMDCVNNILANSKDEDLSDDDKYYIGLVYFNNENLDEAIKFFVSSDSNKAWYYLAKIYILKNNFSTAKNYLVNGLQKYPSEFNKEELSSLIYSLESISPSSRDLWNELETVADKNIMDIILFNKAKYQPKDDAMKIYKYIVETYSKGDYAAESLKNLFWYQYNLKNYKIAQELALRHIALYKNANSSPEMNYWLGKIYERDDSKNAALKVYNTVISKFPDDYYAMRAYSRIAYLTKDKDYNWEIINPKIQLSQENFVLNLPYSYNDIKTKFGPTLAELLMVQDFTTIEYFNGFKEPFIEAWIYSKKGLRSAATTTARNAMDEYPEKPLKTDKKWEFVYPCYFSEEINKYSQRNKISPFMLVALIREESYFNPLALSSSGAVGLAQLLPSTAKEVSERKGYGRINEFLLFNPEINIKYGAAYFAQIKKQHNNSNLYAVASYNGGAGAVSSWLRNTTANDADEFVENIPYPETKNYVKKVFRSYWNYARLYSQNR